MALCRPLGVAWLVHRAGETEVVSPTHCPCSLVKANLLTISAPQNGALSRECGILRSSRRDHRELQFIGKLKVERRVERGFWFRERSDAQLSEEAPREGTEDEENDDESEGDEIRSRSRRIIVPNLEKQIERELCFKQGNASVYSEAVSEIFRLEDGHAPEAEVESQDAHKSSRKSTSEPLPVRNFETPVIEEFSVREEFENSLESEQLGDVDADFKGKDEWLIEFQKHLPSENERIHETSGQVSNFSGLSQRTSRRRVLGAPMFMSLLLSLGWSLSSADSKPAQAATLPKVKIDLTKLPTKSQFDTADLRLRDAATISQQALQAATVEEEEILWTEVIELCGKAELDAEWVPDILARALGNRGNARSRQGRLELALGDYNRSIALAPYAVDPVLNRGVTLESLGRLDEASADYEAVLQVQPDDPAAWNNMGNVKAAMRQWDAALLNYFKAVQLAPKFAFAAANYALALYQVGRDNEAVRQFRNLLRKYPEFSDIRAALAVSLYEQGFYGEAETNWGRLEDLRYMNREWVWNTRRWPPRLASALEDFLDVKLRET